VEDDEKTQIASKTRYTLSRVYDIREEKMPNIGMVDL
jgi:hypothetical protein